MTNNALIVAVVGIIFLVLQFVFRADSRGIVDKISTKLDKSIKGFTSHLMESNRMCAMMEDMQKAHEVKDSEGRPMWYMPPSVISTQNEMVKIMHVLAQTQNATVVILERLERKIEKEHERV